MSEEHFDEFEHFNYDQDKAMKSGHSGESAWIILENSFSEMKQDSCFSPPFCKCLNFSVFHWLSRQMVKISLCEV